jgi:Spy/CpxP family protein refolding chaperone
MNAISKYRLAAYLTLLFLAGAVTGGSLSWSLINKSEFKPAPGDMAQHIRRSLQSQLNLTTDQVEKIRPAVDEAVKNLALIHEQTRPQMDEVFKNLNTELAKCLTPAQNEKLQELDRKRRDYQKNDHRPH